MPMLQDTIGLDLHKRETQVCILTTDGELIERRIATTRERFTAVLGGRSPARILVEASTESEWVARHLESLGHEVIVADPSYAPMYATRSRRVKTDKRDARTLAEACRLGAYRAVHRVSAAQRHVRSELAVRDALVRTRTRYVALIKARVRSEGLRLAQGDPEYTARKLAALTELSDTTRAELTPLLTLLEPINRELEGRRRAHRRSGRDRCHGASPHHRASDRPRDCGRLCRHPRRRHALPERRSRDGLPRPRAE